MKETIVLVIEIVVALSFSVQETAEKDRDHGLR